MIRYARILPWLAAALAACSGSDRPAADSTGAANAIHDTADAADTALATRAGETTGLDIPESVVHDPALDVYFISNIGGNPGAKDNDGFIARVHPDSLSAATRIVQGGRGGATLHAPKGLAIQGDTLWVSDIDVVRGFDKRTGAPVATIAFTGLNPVFLNDVVTGIDGIYVTDSNIRFESDGTVSHPGADRIFRITGRKVEVVAEGPAFGSPNGIAWDSAGARFLVASYATAGVLGWQPGDTTPSRIGNTAAPGQYDGIALLPDGRIVVTSWADSAVHVLRDGQMRTLVRGVAAPADLGVDRKRRRLLVPQFNDGVVSYWRY